MTAAVSMNFVWPWTRTVSKEPVEQIARRLETALDTQEHATEELRALLFDVKRGTASVTDRQGS